MIEDNYPLESKAKFQLLIMVFHRCYVLLRLSRNGYTAHRDRALSATQLQPNWVKWIKIEGSLRFYETVAWPFPRNLPSVEVFVMSLHIKWR